MMDSACAEYDVLRNDVVPVEQMMCCAMMCLLRRHGLGRKQLLLMTDAAVGHGSCA